jgi:rod shape-determining protein MreB
MPYQITSLAISLISINKFYSFMPMRIINKVGGYKFDEAIRNGVRHEYNLIIGEKSAEKIKINLSELTSGNHSALVYGRDIVTGLPIEKEIPTKLVDESLEEHFAAIIDSIKVILERTPPELAADIYRHGVYLTGGASQVNNLAKQLSEGTGLSVNVAESPTTSVTMGLAKIIKNDAYKSVAYTIEGMSK